jgi:hypothetical protein
MSRVIVVIRRHTEYIPWMNIDEKIQWWNEIFKIPFIDFRKEICSIAFNNHDLINADKIYYTLDEFIVDQQLIQPSDWILPIDDDDWLCNDICTYIRNNKSKENFLSWRCNVISIFKLFPPHFKQLEKIETNIHRHISTSGMVQSCCYALRGSNASFNNLNRHMKISHLERDYMTDIESCYINLTQSTVALRNYISSKQDLIDSVKEVNALKEDMISHKPEFVAKLRLIKDLFASL